MRTKFIQWLCTSIAMCVMTPASVASASIDEAREIAVETYVYAYPVILTELTRRLAMSAPAGAMNRINHRREFPDPRATAVVRPNADTLYSVVWFDVAKEPQVFTIPDSQGRYYLLQFMDMWTDTFAVPGTRTTGNQAQTIVLASADWSGNVPAGALLIRSPTAMGWMIGRVQTNGANDYANVHEFQNGMSLRPLSVYEKSATSAYTPPKTPVDPSWELTAPPVVLIERLSAQKYFELFAELMNNNPPHANDYSMIHRMARLGIEPAKSSAYATASSELKQALDGAASIALPAIKRGFEGVGIAKNGWQIATSAIGTYGTDYRARAQIAFGGFGANPIEDALYPGALADLNGNPFSSDKRYVLHFSKEQLPPVRAFWSLAMYDARQVFSANPINRYSIGDRDALKLNADGSLDLYIQRESPGAAKESNWLPTPTQGTFSMTLRLYWPKPAALNGEWVPPAIREVK